MHGWIDGWNGWMDGWMDGWVYMVYTRYIYIYIVFHNVSALAAEEQISYLDRHKCFFLSFQC